MVGDKESQFGDCRAVSRAASESGLVVGLICQGFVLVLVSQNGITHQILRGASRVHYEDFSVLQSNWSLATSRFFRCIPQFG